MTTVRLATRPRWRLVAALLLGAWLSSPATSAQQIPAGPGATWSNDDAWTLESLEGRTTAILLALGKHLEAIVMRSVDLAPYGRDDLRNTEAAILWDLQVQRDRAHLDRVRSVLSGRGLRASGPSAQDRATKPADWADGDSWMPVVVTLSAEDAAMCGTGSVALADCAMERLNAGAWTVPLGRAITVFAPDGVIVGTVFAAIARSGHVATALAYTRSSADRLGQQMANAGSVAPDRMDAMVASFIQQIERARVPDGQGTAVARAIERVRALIGRAEQAFADFSRENETTRRASVACTDVGQLPATNAAKAEQLLPQMKPVSASVVASLAEARRLTAGCRSAEDGRQALALHEKARSDYWDLDGISRDARSHLRAIPTFYADLKAARLSRVVAARSMVDLQRLVDEDLLREVDQARSAVDVYRQSLDRHARSLGHLFREVTDLRAAFPADHEAPAYVTAGFKRLADAIVAEEADVLAEGRAAAIDETLAKDHERILSLRRIAQARLDDLRACAQMGSGDVPEALGRDVKRIEQEVAAVYRAASQAFDADKDLPEKASACGR